MKSKLKSIGNLPLTAIVLVFAGFTATSASAADQTYDATSFNDVWDTITTNWDASTATWTNDNNAIFTGIGESVTVEDAISVANLTFNSGGFTIAPGFGSLSLAAGTSTISTATGTSIISALIGGSGALDKTGTGTLNLSAPNTFAGGLSISGGTLSIAANTALGGTAGTAGAVTIDGGILNIALATTAITNTHVTTIGASGGTILVGRPTSGTPTYIMGAAGNLTGGGTLTVSGDGSLGIAGNRVSTLVLGTANTGFTGNVIVGDGAVLEYANVNGVGTGSTFTVNNHGVLSATNLANSRDITLNSGAALAFQNGNNGNFSGNITLNGDSGIRMQDWYSGTLRTGTISNTVTGAHKITVDSGNNLGTGGTLILSGFDAKASSADLVLNAANLSINSSAGTPAASVTRATSLTVNSGNLTVTGVASQATNEVFGTLNLGGGSAQNSHGFGSLTGYSTWSLAPNAATTTALTFTSMGARTSGSWVAIAGTVGLTPAAGTGNIFFTNAPSGANLVGAGGTLASGTASVIPWLRDTGGGAIFGYDATNGIAPVATLTINPELATADQNINWNAASILTGNRTINSFQAAFSGVNLGGFTLTVTSGVITADNANFSNGTLDFGAAEAQLSVHQARQLNLDLPVTGSGGLTFVGYRTNSGNAGRLRLGGANTYTGPTNFYNYGNGAAEVYLTNSLALQNSTLNHVAGRGYNFFFGNGGTSGQTAYAFGGLSGSANLNLNNNNSTAAPVNLTVGGNNESTTYSGVLTSTVAGGSLTKIGTGTLTLTGTNTFTGNTTVNDGILAVDGDAIANNGRLVIDGGKVAPTGTEIVGSLYFGGAPQAAGTWGASGSGATNIDNARFTGTGVVSVTGATDFATWAITKGLTAGVNDGTTQDPDFDGVPNLLEYVFGGLPIGTGSSNPAIVPTIQTLDNTNLILTFRRSDLSESDTTQTLQISTNLGAWTDYATIGQATLAPVTVTENSPTADMDTVTVTIPVSNEFEGKLFARLNVVKN